jgi:hypothetical protein
MGAEKLHRIKEAASILRVTMLQTLPSDDKIITENIQEALTLLDAEIAAQSAVAPYRSPVFPYEVLPVAPEPRNPFTDHWS